MVVSIYGSCLLQSFDLLPEKLHDPRASHVDAPDGNPEPFGNCDSGGAINGRRVKGFPSDRIDSLANDRCSSVKQCTSIFEFEFCMPIDACRRRIHNFLRKLPSIGAYRRRRPFGKMVGQQIAGDPIQPCSKPCPLLVWRPGLGRPSNSQQELLHEILSVSGLQSTSTCDRENGRSVYRSEFTPRLNIVDGCQSQDQTDASLWEL